MNPAYITALLMGLAGSLHCAGMCGPIMLFMPFHRFNGIKKFLAVSLYHLSRISIYALMALIIYSFRSAFNPAIQQYISIGLGSLLLLAGLISFFPIGNRFQVKLPWSAFVQKQLGRFIADPSLLSTAASGLLNGLLPCGLVYMALSATLTLQSPAQAMIFTYIFGIGTLPVLLGIIIFKSRIIASHGSLLRKFTPFIVFSFGCLFLLRGMNLGIPYLSPKVEISHGQMHSCCCHKK